MLMKTAQAAGGGGVVVGREKAGSECGQDENEE
jgi:hypothetical protein